jgi:hypothetical protein
MLRLRNFVLMFCCCVVIYLSVGVSKAVPVIEDRYAPWGEKEYKRLLKKHGLDRKISVLQTTWNGVTYFERNGQRCLF